MLDLPVSVASISPTRSPHVLHVLEATAGGTARHVTGLIEGLRGSIHSDLVYSTHRGEGFGPHLERLRAAGAHCFEIPMQRALGTSDLLAAARLRRILRALRPDVIHLHSSKAGGIGRIASLGTQVPTLYTPHGWAFLCGGRRGRLFLALERALCARTTHVAAVSHSEAQHAERVGFSPSAISVIANAVCLREPRASEPGPLLRLGSLGRMVRQKDPLSLVRFAAALRATGCDFRLEIGGGGPMLEAARRAIASAGLEARIRLLGEVSDVDAFYQRLDAFVSTSRYEGMPYAVLDAMAWGLPTVAFAAPGVDELIEHERTGLLAPEGDAAALAHQANRLARGGLAARLGSGARQRIAVAHDPKEQLERFESLYRGIAGIGV